METVRIVVFPEAGVTELDAGKLTEHSHTGTHEGNKADQGVVGQQVSNAALV